MHFALGCCLKWGGKAIFAHAFRYVDDENRSRYWVAIHRWNRRETPVTTDASVRGRLSEMCPKNPILLLHHVSWFRTSIGFLAGPTGYYGVVLARCIKMRCILCLGPLVLKHPIFASKELPLQRGVVGSEFTPAKARVAVR